MNMLTFPLCIRHDILSTLLLFVRIMNMKLNFKFYPSQHFVYYDNGSALKIICTLL